MATFKPNQKIKLRFINASSMPIYDVRIPDLKILVVATDGQNIEPVEVDEFRFGNNETHDIILKPKQNQSHTIIAEPITIIIPLGKSNTNHHLKRLLVLISYFNCKRSW